ncbi:hypothetical protein [Tropicimonas sp. IMCC6043]|uniref:hypothetical protein n=1 Tax=Tropicimonas sp. IMCC6043 TaxID=2510645 RepID=UPI00101C15E3|nr:hypothetical protein [Tropicimonas sp. IMCC6043]RYH11849.1 hypothetical protein EU800_04250 [Tropicimonas sp. IMCC6043]
MKSGIWGSFDGRCNGLGENPGPDNFSGKDMRGGSIAGIPQCSKLPPGRQGAKAGRGSAPLSDAGVVTSLGCSSRVKGREHIENSVFLAGGSG